MNIVEAIRDSRLFLPCFKGSLDSWGAWIVLLKAAFCIPMDAEELAVFRKWTGRENPPSKPVREVWVQSGRRTAKSFMFAVIAVYVALFRNFKEYLVPGERGTVLVVAQDRVSAQIILNYVRGILTSNPVLEQYIATELRESDAFLNQ